MKPKVDPKDDRIAELELGLEAANAEVAKLRTQLEQQPALTGEIANLREKLEAMAKRGQELEAENAELRMRARRPNPKAIGGLDPAKAGQLKAGAKLACQNGVVAFADPGHVAFTGTAEEAAKLRQKLGTSIAVHHVTQDSFDEIVRRGLVAE